MNKKQIVVGVALVAAVALGAAGATVLHKPGHVLVKSTAAADEVTGSQDASNDGINISVGSASDMGQLGVVQPNQNGLGLGGGSSSSNGALSPDQLKDYDKYKNENNALFGDVQAGSGDELTVGKKATIYYKGWLTNGQLFDQSHADASGNLQPFSYTMGSHQVVLGLEEGTLGMKVGGTRVVIVPPAVGYGAQGNGAVPANAVMVFQIQLLSVQ